MIPGVSSATGGVPSALGLPLTHRGVARGFAVLTGHDPLGLSVDTLVFLMPLGHLSRLREVLLERLSPHTPVALKVKDPALLVVEVLKRLRR